MTLAQRLKHVRARMAERGYDALLVPRADEYLGEYIPARNERLHWLSGFTGSAGMAVVLRDSAAIFVDGRYTVQVRDQVPGDLFSYHHLIEEPPLHWICAALAAGTVCCDPRLHSLHWYETAAAQLEQAGLALASDTDNLIDACWEDRPAATASPALLLDQQFTGESSADKRRRLGQQVDDQHCESALIFAPDSVSWLLNIRGTDMPQLPVLLSFALLTRKGALALFVDPDRLPDGFATHVGAGVEVYPEHAFVEHVEHYRGKRVLADPATANAWTQLALRAAGALLVAGDDPVALPKACKNDAEIAGTRRAHRRDAVAKVRFLSWLDAEIAAGQLHDEAVLADKLLALRRTGQHFHALSFDTISAAAGNAAMCHYNHTNGVPSKLAIDSVYLCDSGAQYLDGTTDVTRTVAVGDPGPEVRRLFTLVLKGHIALARARFPRGTTGTQLDALARQFLWSEGFDFDHGTGHGVGVFLSVHEGPQRISKAYASVALEPGMIVSNEPGYYRNGQFGMRCENLLLVREASGGDETPMLSFETLTLAPFDARMLDLSLLRDDELAWLNDYHARVAGEISPMLLGSDAVWLAKACAAISR